MLRSLTHPTGSAYVRTCVSTSCLWEHRLLLLCRERCGELLCGVRRVGAMLLCCLKEITMSSFIFRDMRLYIANIQRSYSSDQNKQETACI